MASLFISYSRKDIATARKLTEAFNGQGLDFWIDWEGIPPTVDWWKEIERGIEQADIFLFLLSPDSVKSKVCKQEIETAVRNGKRLIPIIVRDINGEEAPTELSHLNWIFLRENDDFNSAFGKLITAVKTDYEWVQAHRELQVRALEWEKSNHESSTLLFGKELQDAEFQLATNTSKEPHPTDLQREYVHQSRQVVDKQRARNTTITTIGIIALAALAVFGFVQAGQARDAEAVAVSNESTAQAASTLAVSNESTAQAASTLAINNAATAQANKEIAEERADIARASELATLANAAKDNNFNLALLFGVEALQTHRNYRTKITIVDLMSTNPQLHNYLFAEEEWMSHAVLSPDGRTFAQADRTTLTLWDASKNTGQVKLSTISNGESQISRIVFNRTGKTLALGSSENTTSLWDVSDPTKPVQSSTLQGPNYVYDFSSNSELLILGNSDGQITIWDVSDPSQPLQASMLPGSNYISALSANSETLIAGNSTGELTFWNISNPTQPNHISTLPEIGYMSESSTNGKVLAIKNIDGNITLWDINDPTQPSQFLTLRELGMFSSFALYNNTLAIGRCREQTSTGRNINPIEQVSPEIIECTKGEINIWDLSDPFDPKVINSLSGHNAAVSEVIFRSKGTEVISKSENAIIFWNLNAKKEPLEISRISNDLTYEETGIALNHAVSSISFSQDNKLVVSGDTNDVVWDVTNPISPIQLFKLEEFDNWISAFSLDNKLIASSNLDSSIILWDVETGKSTGKTLQEIPVTCITFGQIDNRSVLASGDQDGNLILWDVSNPKHPDQLLTMNGHSDRINSVAFSQDGTMISSGGEDGLIILWDTKTGQPIGTPMENNPLFPVTSVAFSWNDKILASRTFDNLITLWDISNPSQPIKFSKQLKHIDYVNQDSERIAISRNQILASGDQNSNISIWDISDVNSPVNLFTLSRQDDDGDNEQVAFNSNGTILAAGYPDGIVILWDMDPNSWIQKTCQRAGRNFTRVEWDQYFPAEEYRKTCDQWPMDEEVTPTPSSAP